MTPEQMALRIRNLERLVLIMSSTVADSHAGSRGMLKAASSRMFAGMENNGGAPSPAMEESDAAAEPEKREAGGA